MRFLMAIGILLLCCGQAFAVMVAGPGPAETASAINECALSVTNVVQQTYPNSTVHDANYLKEVAYHACLNKSEFAPIALLIAIIDVESNWIELTNEERRQSTGPMQVLASHAKRFGLTRKQLAEPRNNIRVGSEIYKEFLIVAHGNQRLALTYYNGSERKKEYAAAVLKKLAHYEKLLAVLAKPNESSPAP